MSTVLLTGFEPFGGAVTNPSWDAVRQLAERAPAAGAQADVIVAELLPCAYDDAETALRQAIARHEPDIVICAGVAAGRSGVTPERIAVNLDEAAAPDNSGAVRAESPIVPGGPVAYFTGLPVTRCVSRLQAGGITAAVSRSAGGYVCNHVFYLLMHLIATEQPALRGGFVHVPLATEQLSPGDDRPALPLGVIVDALAVIVETVVEPAPAPAPRIG